MNFRALHTAVFRREPARQVLWQPRIEHWYNINKEQGTLPERYREMSLLDLFDDLGCSVRPYWAFNDSICIEEDPAISVELRIEGPRVTTIEHTPVGDLVTITERAADATHTWKYPVETPADMRTMAWKLERRKIAFDPAHFEKACALIGDRAAPSVYILRVNLARLLIEFMGFEKGLIALYEMPDEAAALLHTVNETDGQLLDVLCECPIEIINFGDNVHQAYCPPPLFTKWVLPEYQRRNELLHAAGKKTYPHWDGECRLLLPFARECGFDGYEAITPVPQGDVTLEEVRDALGDLILLDGIPCTDFLPDTPIESLLDNTQKCVEYFYPHLILGISDEISPVGDIERVRLVSDLVRNCAGA